LQKRSLQLIIPNIIEKRSLSIISREKCKLSFLSMPKNIISSNSFVFKDENLAAGFCITVRLINAPVIVSHTIVISCYNTLYSITTAIIISDISCIEVSSNKPEDNEVVTVSLNLIEITGRQPLTRTRKMKAVWQCVRMRQGWQFLVHQFTTVYEIHYVNIVIFTCVPDRALKGGDGAKRVFSETRICWTDAPTF
jgi:hypothetical protein